MILTDEETAIVKKAFAALNDFPTCLDDLLDLTDAECGQVEETDAREYDEDAPLHTLQVKLRETKS